MTKITADINPYVYAEPGRHELTFYKGRALLALLNVTTDELEDIELELSIIVSQIMAYRRKHTPQDI